MNACPSCGNHVLGAPCACPHCGHALKVCAGPVARTAAAALMGLALAGCGDKDDTGPMPQPEYGVFDTSIYADADGDGVSPADGDCDDADASRYPGATEAAGDGVDSDCDGNDDP